MTHGKKKLQRRSRNFDYFIYIRICFIMKRGKFFTQSLMTKRKTTVSTFTITVKEGTICLLKTFFVASTVQLQLDTNLCRLCFSWNERHVITWSELEPTICNLIFFIVSGFCLLNIFLLLTRKAQYTDFSRD